MNDPSKEVARRITADNKAAWVILPLMYLNREHIWSLERLQYYFKLEYPDLDEKTVGTTLSGLMELQIVTNTKGPAGALGYWCLSDVYKETHPDSDMTPIELARMFHMRKS